MTITKTKTTDKAIYECIASNLAGNETKVITLIVESRYPCDYSLRSYTYILI